MKQAGTLMVLEIMKPVRALTVLELTDSLLYLRSGHDCRSYRDLRNGLIRRSPSIRAGTKGVPSRPEKYTLGEGMPHRDAEITYGTPFVSSPRPAGAGAPETIPARNGSGGGSPDNDRIVAHPAQGPVLSAPLRVVMLYDMDACHGPTGVTRHALAQLERLAQSGQCLLSVDLGTDDPS